MQSLPSISLRDALIALLVVAGWGLHIVIIRIGVQEIPPLLLLSIRFFLTALVMLPFAQRLSRQEIKAGFRFALSMYIGHYAFTFAGLEHLPAATFSLIMQIQVLLVVVFAWLLEKEKFGLKTICGVGIGFIGSCFIFGSPDITSMIGLILALASATTSALGVIDLRKIKHFSLPSMAGWCSLMALPFMIIATMVIEKPDIPHLINTTNMMLIGFVLFYQVIIMNIAMYVWKKLITRNTVQSVMAFLMIQPFFTVFFAYIFLSEVLSLQSAMGGLIAFFGVMIVTLRRYQKTQQHEI